MDEQIRFRFSIQGLPEGEALTGSEVEQKLLEQLDATNGTCVETLWSLAVLYQQTGHLDQASGCIQRVIGLADDPEGIGSAYLGLGQLEESRGDFTAAARWYRRALALEPCSVQTWYFIHNNLGYSLNQVNQHESAVPHLRRAVEIDPELPNAYKNLALSYVALGDLEQAAELFIAATQADAADPRSLDHLDALLDANPALEVDVRGLRERVEACRQAVALAREQQADLIAQWEALRQAQRPDE